jgi:hypothetical protein
MSNNLKSRHGSWQIEQGPITAHSYLKFNTNVAGVSGTTMDKLTSINTLMMENI